MNAYIYIEGGGTGAQSKDMDIRCREGFRKLLENCGFQGRMPRLVACGGRHAAYEMFKTAVSHNSDAIFVALWIDSEEPLQDLDAAWKHLSARENWTQPNGASDEQVLFMTTCMETLLLADPAALRSHFGDELQMSALLPLNDLEKRSRHEALNSLIHATRNCSNAYQKGKRSFEVLGKVRCAALAEHLPSFARACGILSARLR